SDGKLYFGGYHGFNIIDIDHLNDNDFLPPVHINEFFIFNKPVTVDSPNSPLNQIISETKKITLSYKQSVLTFGFNAINFTSPEKSLYAYKMEGYDQSWNYCDASRRYATYTNLNPGPYTFKVIASNNDGLWNTNEASISLVILPPFWLTWWFKAICIISLILAVYLISYLKTKSLQIQKITLEKIVKERTHDLSNLNEELQVINENLKEKQDRIEEQSEELQNQARSLQMMNEKLLLSNSTKDKFFSIISHDLKGPFNSILGFSETLKTDYSKMSDEIRKQCIDLINTSSLKAFSLLENLLTWARSQTNRIEYTPQVNDIGLIIKNNVESFKEIVLKKNITIIDETKGYHYALSDIYMINTVIRNLISNAIKFSHKSGSIIVKATETDGFVQVSIKDSGIGMDQNLQNMLFKIGEVTTRQGTSKETGTGLGLFLCKEFVEKNGGKIWVESEEGRGSVFFFTLPIA
ncbi:MAG TPA: ATP-binding protein, partial [Bacteroidales bacterium]